MTERSSELSMPLAQQAEINGLFSVNTEQDLPTVSTAVGDYVQLESLFSPAQTFDFRDQNRYRNKQYLNTLTDSNQGSYTQGNIKIQNGKDLATNLIPPENMELDVPVSFGCLSGGQSTDQFFLKAGSLGIIRGFVPKTTSNTVLSNESSLVGPYRAKTFLLDSSYQKVKTEGPYIGLYGIPSDSSVLDPAIQAMINLAKKTLVWNSSTSVFETNLRIPFNLMGELLNAMGVQQLGMNFDIQVYNYNPGQASGTFTGEYVPFCYQGSGTNPFMTIGNSISTACNIYYPTVVLPASAEIALAEEYSRGGKTNNLIFKTITPSQAMDTTTAFTTITKNKENQSDNSVRTTRVFMDFPTAGSLTSHAFPNANTGAMTGGIWPLQNQVVNLTNTQPFLGGTAFQQNQMIYPQDFYQQVRDTGFSRGQAEGKADYDYGKFRGNPWYIVDYSRSPSVLANPDAGASLQLSYSSPATGQYPFNKLIMIESESAISTNQTNQGTTVGLGPSLIQS